jgi:hypothetical protein
MQVNFGVAFGTSIVTEDMLDGKEAQGKIGAKVKHM